MGSGGEERKEGKDRHRDGGQERESRVVGKKSEKWPKAGQKKAEKSRKGRQKQQQMQQVQRGGRGRGVKMNREGWPHITCGRMSAVGHWLSLSWVPRALFTLSPFSTDLS